MSLSGLLDRLDAVLVHRHGAQRSPHKPLYILLCISNLQKGLERLQTFESIRDELAAALRLFGGRTVSVHPEYPFWRLQNDHLAEVTFDGNLSFRESNDDPKVSSLLECGAQGGFLASDFNLLSASRAFQSLVIHKVLDSHFPVSVHEDIVHFFSLRLDDLRSNDRRSDFEFRRDVLQAYKNRCAISGFTASIGEVIVGVEAAHICWPQSGGNDQISNGIAMTTLHRRMFHLGLFRVRKDYSIEVSPLALQSSHSPFLIQQLSDVRMIVPDSPTLRPDAKALEWHSRWVFRTR
jgi:putative restriction endonuclease